MLDILKYTPRFLFFVLFQGLILNNIQIHGYINPYFYILFLISSLPCNTKREYVLIIAFLLGISIDIFSNTYGMHAFACVTMAFFRPFLIKNFSPIDDYGERRPSIAYFGLGAFMRYSFVLILIHHTSLFLIEFFSFQQITLLLLRIIFSSIITFLMIIVVEKFNTK